MMGYCELAPPPSSHNQSMGPAPILTRFLSCRHLSNEFCADEPLVSEMHPLCPAICAVCLLGRFEGLGPVPVPVSVPCYAVCVEASASCNVFY